MSTIVDKIANASIISADPNAVSCELEGEAVILHLTSGVYFGLNAIGADLWAHLESPRTFGEIRDRMLSLYAVTPERCDVELAVLLREMNTHGLVQITDPDIEPR